MSPADRALWLRVNRRAAALQPEVGKALLDAWRIVRAGLSDLELTHLIVSGRLDQIIDDALLNRAFIPLRDKLQHAVEKGFQSTVIELPKAGKVDGAVAVAFDTLSPKVIEAVRKLDTRVINTLKDEVRETVRAYVENGLRDGRSPAVVARELRGVIGLSPSQLQQVENFRDALEGKPGRDVTNYTLRNRALDRLIAKGPLTQEQIDRYTEQYNRKRIAQNAATNAKTATLDSYKLGQKLSWQEARDKGLVNGTLMKSWITVGDDRVRPEHQEMQGETVPFDNTYSNGDDIPGESTFNCRCLNRVFVKKAA